MPKPIKTELEQEIINTFIESKAIDFDACGNIIAKFGARAARAGTGLTVSISKWNFLACGWPGPEIGRLQIQQGNEIGG
jgi:hypothetical protein